ncbi:MAG: hypothetical protein KGH63_01685 [Candidatus Micrarchaeota archaeon]|nr:hypothetical protein [Candidatus Micrarchaeota archaeon]
MERICPSCGASSTSRPFVGEHCANCALDQLRPGWPSSVELLWCPHCDRIWRSPRWMPNTPQLIAAAVAQLFEKAHVPGHYNAEAKQWEGVWTGGHSSVPFTQPFEVKMKKTICPDCNRHTSGYFEGIIQLRGPTEACARMADKLARRINRKTSIPKMESMHGGLDIYVVLKKDIPSVIEQEGLTFTRSEKLAGEKNGERLYRSSFLVRLGPKTERDAGPVVKIPKRERAKKN